MSASQFFRNPATGEIVIAQAPNPPLWIFLAATVTTHLTAESNLRDALGFIARVSLLVWATLEITRGDSPFRRVLGVAVATWTIYSVAASLLG